LRLNAVVARMRVNTVDCGNVSFNSYKKQGIQRGQNFHFQKIQCNSRYRKQNSELSNNLQRIENVILNFPNARSSKRKS